MIKTLLPYGAGLVGITVLVAALGGFGVPGPVVAVVAAVATFVGLGLSWRHWLPKVFPPLDGEQGGDR